MEAVLPGAREVGFTVLSMSLSLIAVFMPILLMGGIVGEFFRRIRDDVGLVDHDFARRLAHDDADDVPLSHGDEARPQGSRFLQRAEAAFRQTRKFYERALVWSLRNPGTIMLILLVTIGLNVYLYYIVPKGFLPNEDTGEMFGGIPADQSISFQSMEKKFTKFVHIVAKDPAVENVTGFTGPGGGGPRGGAANSGSIFIQLKPVNERDVSTDEVITGCAASSATSKARGCFSRVRRTFAPAAARATRNINTRCRPTRSTN